MTLWPYKTIVMESPLRPAELLKRLTRVVAPPLGRVSNTRTEFLGTITEQGFEIRRRIEYRNSFLPIIHGRVHPSAEGARVEVKMRLRLAIVVFGAFWVGMLLLCMLGVVIKTYSGKRIEPIAIIGPIGMLLFFFVLMTVSYRLEARKAIFLLNELFETNNL